MGGSTNVMHQHFYNNRKKIYKYILIRFGCPLTIVHWILEMLEYILANDYLNGILRVLKFWNNLYISRKRWKEEQWRFLFFVFLFKLKMDNGTFYFQ
jgi:hypothetical protein